MLREICFLSLKCYSMRGRNFCMLEVKCKIPKIVSQYRRILKAFMCVSCRIYFCVHLYSACIHCGPWPCVTPASKYFPLHRLNHLCGTFNHSEPSSTTSVAQERVGCHCPHCHCGWSSLSSGSVVLWVEILWVAHYVQLLVAHQ